MNDALKNEKFKVEIKRVLKKSVEFEKKSQKVERFQRIKIKIKMVFLMIFLN